MGTSYYKLQEPLTLVRMETKGGHDTIRIFEKNAYNGILVFTKGMGKIFIRMICETEPVAHSYWGGKEHGRIVDLNIPKKEFNEIKILIDENDNLISPADLLKYVGKNKKNEK